MAIPPYQIHGAFSHLCGPHQNGKVSPRSAASAIATARSPKATASHNYKVRRLRSSVQARKDDRSSIE